MTREQFEKLIAEHFFFEFGVANGEYYGTPRVTTAHLHEETPTKPRRSRAASMKKMIEDAQNAGELTLGHFVDNHGVVAEHPEIAKHRDVPLSVFFAHAAHGHPAHSQTIDHIREAMYDMTTPYVVMPITSIHHVHRVFKPSLLASDCGK